MAAPARPPHERRPLSLRGSLYGKLLLWLALNLLLIAALGVVMAGRSGLGWSMLLSEPVRERLLTIADHIAADVSAASESARQAVLESYAAQYGVAFALHPFGRPSADAGGPPPDRFGIDGPPLPPPDRAADRFGPPPLPHEPPPRFADPHVRAGLIFIRSSPRGGTFEVHIPAILRQAGAPPQPVEVRAAVPGLVALLRLLGVAQWLLFALLVAVLSALLWWPFIWNITRTIVQLTGATHDIAAGRFEVRVATRRRDELGRLADAVNRMAQRLQNFVAGQKQFLADVAHEVTSPLARLQAGLGILESRLDGAADRTLDDLREELQQMSALLDQLLLFSRAGMQSGLAPPQALELRPLLLQVLQREDPQHAVRFDIEPGLRAMGHGLLLERAVANLVRNALRYAGAAQGAVELAAAANDGSVEIAVRDRGPGVPEAMLSRLGEPFFRPEHSRSRDSGGFGLGLAIVHRCVEACGGSLVLRNRSGGGFEACIRLASGRAADAGRITDRMQLS